MTRALPNLTCIFKEIVAYAGEWGICGFGLFVYQSKTWITRTFHILDLLLAIRGRTLHRLATSGIWDVAETSYKFQEHVPGSVLCRSDSRWFSRSLGILPLLSSAFLPSDQQLVRPSLLECHLRPAGASCSLSCALFRLRPQPPFDGWWQWKFLITLPNCWSKGFYNSLNKIFIYRS